MGGVSTDRIITTGEAANRAAVALDLADALTAMPNGDDPDVVAALADKHWTKIAELAGCDDGYTPSEETRRTVVAIIRRRRRDLDSDPFKGFPQ